MVENQLPEEVVQKIDPNRRKFILGILAAGITAPTVASFVMGKANKSAIAGTPIRPASLIDSSGNFKFEIFDPSGNYPNESANFIYDNMSGNFLRDASGNFALDPSGNLQCGTSGNVLLDGSGNIMWNYDFSGNFDPSANFNFSGNFDPSANFNYNQNPVWQLDPSGNWSYDGSGNIQLYWGANLDPSGNQFNDYYFHYDSNGVVNFYSTPQNPGLACVVSANHIQQVQAPATTTTTVAPTTTTVPVTPITPNGSIPATR